MPNPDLSTFRDPPREFSLCPFWFLNDDLEESELLRQLDDFCAHGVYRFVLHPRVGLPESIGWMSERFLYFVKFIVEAAADREMQVVLYDEGMYPSGSSAGQVVAEDPAFQIRGWVAVDLDEAEPGSFVNGVYINDAGAVRLADGQTLIAEMSRQTDGHRIAIVDRPIDGKIRGLHYTDHDHPARDGDDWAERCVREHDYPPLADMLNPDAVQCFIRCVHEKYFATVGEHFGKTITAIFTDEPMMAKNRQPGELIATTDLLTHINGYLGYDFTPFLPALWFDEEPDAARHRQQFHRAVQARLDETYYEPIAAWCDQHGIALTGHPAGDMAIGHMRHTQEPCQDLVWNAVMPGESALLQPPATTAKAASSVMIHNGYRRNANEFAGAYGDQFNPDLYKWLVDWLIVRGCNDLMPHAFFYSVRGARVDECPPQLGPHAGFWNGSNDSPDGYRAFADYCRRMAWLNTESEHVCDVAIMGLSDILPWEAAAVLQRSQIDFNYIEARHLWEDATVDETGIHIRGMHYKAVILDGLRPPGLAKDALATLAAAGRVIVWRPQSYRLDPVGATMVTQADELLGALQKLVVMDVQCEPRCESLRVRHVRKCGDDWYVLFNEARDPMDVAIRFAAEGQRYAIDPMFVQQTAIGETLRLMLPGFATGMIRVVGE